MIYFYISDKKIVLSNIEILAMESMASKIKRRFSFTYLFKRYILGKKDLFEENLAVRDFELCIRRFELGRIDLLQLNKEIEADNILITKYRLEKAIEYLQMCLEELTKRRSMFKIYLYRSGKKYPRGLLREIDNLISFGLEDLEEAKTNLERLEDRL